MKRNIHDIYDAIMKIIATVYGSTFLRFIGIEKEIRKMENVEFTTLKGEKFYPDFLCLLDDGTLCHIEFQYPKSKPAHLDRFFHYNIMDEVKHQKLTETTVFNFTHSTTKPNSKPIGKSKSFHPENFYLGNIDFKRHFENINYKQKSNRKLTNEDELMLMLICLNPNQKNRFEILERIAELLKSRKLFDETKYEYIKAIIKLEIENLLTIDEQKKIKEEIKMSPQAEKVITQAINEVNLKVISENRHLALKQGIEEGLREGIEEGLREGREEGFKQGRKDAMKDIAKAFKDKIDLEELSQTTGLSIEEIEKL